MIDFAQMVVFQKKGQDKEKDAVMQYSSNQVWAN